MHDIGSALGDEIYVRPRIAAVRSVILSGLYFKFLNRIRIRNRHSSTERTRSHEVIHLRPVHLIVVVVRSAPMGRKSSIGGIHPGISAAKIRSIIYVGNHSRRKTNDLRVIAVY